MPHMPATGVSGVDLYAEATKARWRWLAMSRPTPEIDDATAEARLLGRRASTCSTCRSTTASSRWRSACPRRPRSSRVPPRGEADRLLRHVDHAGRLRVAAGHGLHRDPRPAAGSAGHQPRLLRQRHDGRGGRRADGRAGRGRVRDRLPAEHGGGHGGGADRAAGAPVARGPAGNADPAGGRPHVYQRRLLQVLAGPARTRASRPPPAKRTRA